MALKAKLDKKAYDKLSEHIKGEYKESDTEEGTYVLEVDGAEDTGALKRAKEHEKEARKKAEDATKKLQEQLEELQGQLEELQNKGKSGDDKVAAAEAKLKAQLAKREKELTDQLTSTQAALKAQMVDSVALRIATELAGDNAEILLPHVARRLQADIADGKAVTKVLAADGSATDLTPEGLQKEFLSNTKFSSIIVGSRASGGGAGGGRKGASGVKKLSEMTATEEAKFANENPEVYQQMVAAEAK
jgi:hypothetical protein